ncbi:hypothetical protein KCP78_00835 [Salmonella enterica subsp. enterica]|nr:hypothetical protein KCP78_00835 [Salmonella enterica subsp. enterica]
MADARFDPTIYIAIGMANLLAISGGSWMVVNGSLTPGELTSFYDASADDLGRMLALARCLPSWSGYAVTAASAPCWRKRR